MATTGDGPQSMREIESKFDIPDGFIREDDDPEAQLARYVTVTALT